VTPQPLDWELTWSAAKCRRRSRLDQDRKRRALASALIAFAHETGVDIVAEGVETAGELNTLCELGVRKVQAYLLSRPRFLADVAHCLTMPESIADCAAILVPKVTGTQALSR